MSDNNIIGTPKRRRRTKKEMLAAGENPLTSQRQNNGYYNDVAVRVRKLVSTYKSQDAKSGLGYCDLDPKEMLDRVNNKVCEVTGAPLYLGRVGGGGQRGKRAFSFSFDRIDNSKPHTMDNVRVVCSIYNIMRGNYGDDEVKHFINILREPVRIENERLRQALLDILSKCNQYEGDADLVIQECQDIAKKTLVSGSE